MPIAWAIVGIPIYRFVENKKWYDRVKYTLLLLSNNTTDLDSISKIHPELLYFFEQKQQAALLNYRTSFRKNMDYSILFTLLFWGLNVVDATVDAHLKGFNVNDDLSLNIKPALLPGNAAGISLVFNIGKNVGKQPGLFKAGRQRPSSLVSSYQNSY